MLSLIQFNDKYLFNFFSAELCVFGAQANVLLERLLLDQLHWSLYIKIEHSVQVNKEEQNLNL